LEVSSSSHFSFLRFVDNSASELNDLAFSLLKRWCHLAREIGAMQKYFSYNKHFAKDHSSQKKFIGKRGLLIVQPAVSASEHPDLVFTRFDSNCVYTHSDVIIKSMPETREHRVIRTKHRIHHHLPDSKYLFHNLVEEIPYIPRDDVIRPCTPCHLPKFLLATCLRVATPGRLPYSYDRSAAWKIQDHVSCSSRDGLLSVQYGLPELAVDCRDSRTSLSNAFKAGGIFGSTPPLGWSNIIVPGECL
jgi:hypothetical protein